MNSRTITAVFDSTEKAEAASRDLAVRVGGVRAALYTSRSDAADLQRLGIVGPDRSVLEEAIRRGNTVLSATIPDDQFDAAADALEAAGAADLDAQEAEWRRSGWAGDTTTGTGAAASSGTAAPAPTRAGGSTGRTTGAATT